MTLPLPATGTILFLLSALLTITIIASIEGSCQDDGNNADIAAWESPPPPSSCRLFLASRRSNDDATTTTTNDANVHNINSQRKLGVYTAVDLPRGAPLTPSGGDILLHLIDVDINNSQYAQLRRWCDHGYLQDPITSGLGGNYEGLGSIFTASSGVGMLASSYNAPSSDNKSSTAASNTNARPNVWAPVGETDEANLPRNISPLAGSFSLHYNLTHIVSHPEGIPRGGEVLVDHDGWHRRQALGKLAAEEHTHSETSTRHNSEHLFQEGICMDNLHYEMSTHGYGRGGFASRYLKKGSIVAPVPVLPIPRQELRFLRSNEWKKVNAYQRKLREGSYESTQLSEEEIQEMLPPNIEWRQQLLLNYCFGHQNSSVLLFPYGHVNYVNHAPAHNPNGPVANVGLQWSEKLIQEEGGGIDPRSLSPFQLMERQSPEGLVLEMVALRDIAPGEEILLDYGSVWQREWTMHVKRWNNEHGTRAVEKEYSPAYIMEDVVSNLRTAEEQLQFPYPDNVFTACFYRYIQNEDVDIDKRGTQQSLMAKERTEAIPWKMSGGLFEMSNLRPCKVIAREPATDRHAPQQQQPPPGKGNMFYTAVIQNRPGLPPNERIPKDQKIIVSGIPRGAIRFVDRPYTSDVHVEGAFRHNIGLEETGIYPEIWLDLA
ncbi:hypothetical protein ACHAXH_005641 [Discostella pseudostelligera]